MAGLSSKLTFHVTFENGRSIHQTFAKMPDETLEHILLKFLAFLLFYSEDLLVEQSVDRQTFQPDLVRLDPQSNQPVLWIDCGIIKQDKLLKICQKNRRCAVYVIQYPLRRLETYITSFNKRETPLLEQACGVTFDQGFLESLGESVRGNNEVQIIQREPQRFFSLIVNDQLLETDIHMRRFTS